MPIETTGKTIDAALNAALEQLNTDRDSVTYEVLEIPKSGFFGIGSSPAKVRVSLLTETESPRSAPQAAPKAARKPADKIKPQPKPKPAVAKPQAVAAKPKPATEKPQTAAAKPAVSTATQPTDAAPSVSASEFLGGILEYMGISGIKITETESGRGLRLEVAGNNLGRMIGRRGETLDALQRIVGAAVNRNSAVRKRVTIDAERYRTKREDSLVALAKSKAEQVVKYNRDILLEPMSSHSRHVVHMALQDNPYVTTHSVGNDPHRRIIISLSGAKKVAEKSTEAL